MSIKLPSCIPSSGIIYLRYHTGIAFCVKGAKRRRIRGSQADRMNHFIPCPTTKDRTVPVGPVPGSANIMISMSSEQLVIIQVVNGRRQGRRMPERGTQSFRSARDSALRHSGQKATEALGDRWIVVQSAEALGWGTAWIFRLSHEIILDEANITSLFLVSPCFLRIFKQSPGGCHWKGVASTQRTC